MSTDRHGAAQSYDRCCASFRWSDVFAELGWDEAGQVDLGRTVVDRHADRGGIALHWHGRNGEHVALSYAELRRQSNRLANGLRRLGIGKGDRIAALMPRVPETIVALIAAFKLGAVYVPIFTAFGPDAVAYRVKDSGAALVFTHVDFRDRVPPSISTPVVTVGPGDAVRDGDISFAALIAESSEESANALYRRDEPAALIYTSGSTGQSKGVMIAANLVAAVWPYLRYAADLRATDVFWPTGDPGWGYGLVCYVVSLAMGVPVHSFEKNPDAETALEWMQQIRATNLATVPTLLRAIMALGPERLGQYDIPMRRITSCGEPLNAEVVRFFTEVWGVPPLDCFGASEMGIPIGYCAETDMTIKPGSMGRALPGQKAGVVDEHGNELPTGTVGRLAVQPGPNGLYAIGYWNNPEADRNMRRGDWLTTGDLARREPDGYFWFEGRDDDLIKTAGYRVGPFEIESAILSFPGVAEAAVVGKPDALRGQLIAAFVVLKPGVTATEALGSEIAEFVKRRIGAHQAPREVTFVTELPKTQTGKIQRFRLRQTTN